MLLLEPAVVVRDGVAVQRVDDGMLGRLRRIGQHDAIATAHLPGSRRRRALHCQHIVGGAVGGVRLLAAMPLRDLPQMRRRLLLLLLRLCHSDYPNDRTTQNPCPNRSFQSHLWPPAN